jgi:hypothetical protein
VAGAPIHRLGAGISARFLAHRPTLNDRDAYANLTRRMISKGGYRFSNKIMRRY